MKIEYITGNLLDAPEKYLVHGCNAQGAYRSGVAGVVRDAYPAAYSAYREKFELSGLRVGETIWVDCGKHVIINAITQEFYGRDKSRVYVDYDGVRAAMAEINSRDVAGRVAMPLIGAGLANGSWPILSAIIEQESTTFQPVVYLLDGRVPC